MMVVDGSNFAFLIACIARREMKRCVLLMLTCSKTSHGVWNIASGKAGE